MAPPWVPYKERLQPGDLSPGDLLPVEDDDPRLVPTYSFGDDPLDADAKAQVRQVAQDLGLGRVRTLSPRASTWPRSAGTPATAARGRARPERPDTCWSCGFLVRIAGPLAGMFGVCANGNANDDGRVVSLDHGCGAHSEVKLAASSSRSRSRTTCSTPSPTTASTPSEALASARPERVAEGRPVIGASSRASSHTRTPATAGAARRSRSAPRPQPARRGVGRELLGG